MDEMTALRELRADAPAPDPGRLAAGRHRLMAEITDSGGTRTPGRRTRWWGGAGAAGVPARTRSNGLVVLTATAVAGVLVAAGVVMQGTGKPHRADVAVPPATPAARLLTTAAAALAATPEAREPGTHQWLYTRTVLCQQRHCDDVDSWIRYGDGRRVDVSDPPADGSLPKHLVAYPARDELGAHPRTDRAWLASLPAEPHALLKRINSEDLTWPFPAPVAAQSPQYQFRRILDILEETQPMPPRDAARFYRALALIPGVTLHPGQLKDAAGRDGLAVGFAGTGEYLMLDPATYAFRGENWDLRGSMPLLRTYALKSSGVVDNAGQRPGGPVPPHSSIVLPGPSRRVGPSSPPTTTLPPGSDHFAVTPPTSGLHNFMPPPSTVTPGREH